MNAQPQPAPVVSTYLSDSLCVGEPAQCGPLAVFPITGPEPVQPYAPFAHAGTNGVAVHELEDGASVNNLIVENPTNTPVLLFEGEEVLGAQQNRTFDATILVDAHSKLRIPVSCVEAGRWDGSRSREQFAPAPQAAHPELRRRKAQRVATSLEAGGPALPDQGEVWDNISAKAQRMHTHSPTGALNDIYEDHRSRLDEFMGAIHLHDGQSGALVAIGDRFVVLDWVSRPEAFSSLFSALLQGYALDALEGESRPAPSKDEAEGFVELVLAAQSSERDGIGLGREVRFSESTLVGSGLVAGTELVQLTVHNGEADGGSTDPQSLRARRIRRPSRRS